MEICFNCFQKTKENGKCRNCGYDEAMITKNPVALLEGTKLQDRYLVGRVLGSGGFGITYIAYDFLNHNICAIKEYVPKGIVKRGFDESVLMPVSVKAEMEMKYGKRDFLEEAAILKELNYIAEVVCITDYFRENGTVYFVMEYLEGEDLSQRVHRLGGKISVAEANHIIYKVGQALDIVHEKAHIYHRDISPGNIIILKDGRIKLIDFGNAKNRSQMKSKTLSIVYKPGFAPPEQYESNGTQGAYTDVYALASTYYYIVSGKRIPEAPLRLQGKNYPKLKNMNLGVNSTISDVVDEALELDYKQRIQTVRKFVNVFYEGSCVKKQKKIPYLEIIGGDNKGKRWRIPPNVMIGIGRSSNYADVIPSKNLSISKLHCEIYYDGMTNQFYLMDHSVNGTYVHRKKIEKIGKNNTAVLQDKDFFILGRDICEIETGVMYE